MRDKLEFYFDFSSPFAYLAFQAIPGVASKFDLRVNYHAIDLNIVKREAGNTGPSNRQIPLKYRYLRRDIDRWGESYGIPVIFPSDDGVTPPGGRDTSRTLLCRAAG